MFFRQKKSDFGTIENVLNQANLYNEFIGRKHYLNEIHHKLNNEINRIVQVDGIGGIGKTSFVHFFCKQLIQNPDLKNEFDFIIWTSSKRNKYTPSGIKTIADYISNYADLIGDIYKFLENNDLIEEDDISDTELLVKNFLHENKVLLIVDNLETLNDQELILFLENLPVSTKAILTTRETLGDFFMARINLDGFSEQEEFPEFLNSQFRIFSGKDLLFTDLYAASLSDLYQYTKGMPLAGQLITHQLAKGTPIHIALENLKSGDAYHDILKFCFQGSIEKLSDNEKKVLYILALSEKEELLTADDVCYISELSNDEVGFRALPQLSIISLCYSQKTDTGEIGYTVPHLAKIYSRNFLNLRDEKAVIQRYETFVQERKVFSNGDLNNPQFRSNASNHKERVASNEAVHALAISNWDYDYGLELIDELIKHNSKFAFLHLIKGKIHENGFLKNSYELAKKELLMALELDENLLEAHIEMGFLEFKNRIGKNRNSKSMLSESLKHFSNAYRLESENQRVNLGLGQVYMAQAKDISYRHDKVRKRAKASLANEHFEKAYFNSSNLTKTQIHSNSITATNQSLNYKANLRDNQKALEYCERALELEPRNSKILKMREDILFHLNPKEYSIQKMKEKGWIKR